MKKFICLSILLIISRVEIYTQDINLSSLLKQIEYGNTTEAEQALVTLKSKFPNDPNTIYLDAVLQKDADKALTKYLTIIEKHPQNIFVEPSLFKVFNYYYSLGFYKKAESYLDKLKKSFPQSEYLKLADRTIPDIDSFDATSLTDKLSEKPAATEQVKSARYSIQAGAFLNIENAKKMSHQLSSDGFEVSLSTKEIGGSIFNIVLVGKFSAIEETEKVLNALESKHKITGRVIDFEKQ